MTTLIQYLNIEYDRLFAVVYRSLIVHNFGACKCDRAPAAGPFQVVTGSQTMSLIKTVSLGLLATSVAMAIAAAPAAAQQQQKPNIIFIMGDDIGWFNVGAYHRGIMSGKTPNLDKLAAEGMMFTDYYAEASCTAGRANFITGELPIRTGMTTVGQAGADVGLPAEASTIATALKSKGMPPGSSAKTTSAI